MHRTFAVIAYLFAGCAIALGGCGDTGAQPAKQTASQPAAEPAPATEPQSVTAYVAASTQDAINELAGIFKTKVGIDVEISPGASNTLANQIVNGAPADVFLSADEKWADFVKEKGFAAETVPLLGNSLVLAVPKDNPAGVKKPEDLLGEKVEHVALAGENVPAGIYAKESLSAAKVYDELVSKEKIVRGKDVRATLNLIELGEVSAGVIYSTDAAASKKVAVAYKFGEKSHDPIRYPLVLTKQGESNPAAKKFFDDLKSESAAKTFERYGFTIPK